jgi:WD40 repeat protein
MKGKTISRLLIFPALLILSLASCRGGETPTASGTSLGMDTETRMPFPFVTQVTPSTTTSLTETEIVTSTSTMNPVEYTLKDWREPTEVITPSNLDRVEKIGTLEFSNTVLAFSWSPDGTKFAASVLQNIIFITESQSFAEIYQLQGRFTAFSYNGMILETGGAQYNLSTGERIPVDDITIKISQGYLEEVEFSPNDEYVIGVGSENIHFYSMKPEINSYYFTRLGAQPIHGSISPDGKLIAVNYKFEEYTEIWDAYQRKPQKRLKIKGISGVSKPRFSSDGKSLFFFGSGEWEGNQAEFIQEWDYRKGQPLDAQILPGIGWEIGMTMDISPVSNVAAFGTKEGQIFIIPLRDCNGINIGNNIEESAIGTIAFRPDGKLIATVGARDDRTIELWGIPSLEKYSTIEPTQKNKNGQTMQCPKIPLIIDQPVPKYEWMAR